MGESSWYYYDVSSVVADVCGLWWSFFIWSGGGPANWIQKSGLRSDTFSKVTWHINYSHMLSLVPFSLFFVGENFVLVVILEWELFDFLAVSHYQHNNLDLGTQKRKK